MNKPSTSKTIIRDYYRAADRKPSQRVPVKKSSRGFMLMLLILGFVLSVASVYIGVARVSYGRNIHRLRSEVSELRNEVRDLETQKARLSSYSNIQEIAESMGMNFPRQAPRTLRVKVPGHAVPPTWSRESLEAKYAYRSTIAPPQNLLARKEKETP